MQSGSVRNVAFDGTAEARIAPGMDSGPNAHDQDLYPFEMKWQERSCQKTELAFRVRSKAGAFCEDLYIQDCNGN